MRKIWGCLIITAIAGSHHLPAADPSEAPMFSTTPKRVFVFKNGLGFVIASGDAQFKHGIAELESLPSAALGALWFSTDKPDQRITEVSSVTREENVPAPALNMAELLRANLGRTARITYSLGGRDGGIKIIDAEILSVPEDRSLPRSDASDPHGFFSSRSRLISPTLAERKAGELVMLRHSGGMILALNLHLIQSVDFAEAELNARITRPVTRTRLRFDGQADAAHINLMYLEKGWNWSPSYLIDISDAQTAKLSLDAVLANDAADLDQADVTFVAGYPNFEFADLAHPLASQQTVGEFIQSLLAHQRGGGRPDYSIMIQNAVSYSNASPGPSFSPAAVAAAEGSGANEDLFFFTQNKVTVAKSGRARFNLLTLEVPYEHIYEWRAGQAHGRYQPPGAPEKENEVWHTIRLRNTDQKPWTTAPALALNGQHPVAQDTLKYTPAGASSSVRITVAADIRARESIEEIGREPVKIAGRDYTRVRVKSTLALHNFKNSPVKMVIYRTVHGEVTDAPAASERRTATSLTELNPTRELEWELDLPSGEERQLDFTYSTILAR